MYTELQKARYLYDLHSVERDIKKSQMLWDMLWEALEKHFDGDMLRVCYVLDLFLHAYLRKTYGSACCEKTDNKNHLRRGLDKYHW